MKTATLNSVFPTLIVNIDEFLSEDQRLAILDYNRKTEKQKHPVIYGDSSSEHNSVSDSITKISNQYDVCKDLCSQLEEALFVYCEQAGWKDVTLLNSWTSTQYPGSQLKSHVHPGSVVSGVIYINVDEKSSPIYFENPNPFALFTETKSLTPFSSVSHKFKAKNGMLILFPSWLMHGSKEELNNSDERVILSFNSRLR